jgi:hypothetical protein
MREVHLYEYSSFTIRQFRFALCAVCLSLGRKYWCVCDKILLLLYNINQQVHLYNQIF